MDKPKSNSLQAYLARVAAHTQASVAAALANAPRVAAIDMGAVVPIFEKSAEQPPRSLSPDVAHIRDMAVKKTRDRADMCARQRGQPPRTPSPDVAHIRNMAVKKTCNRQDMCFLDKCPPAVDTLDLD